MPSIRCLTCGEASPATTSASTAAPITSSDLRRHAAITATVTAANSAANLDCENDGTRPAQVTATVRPTATIQSGSVRRKTTTSPATIATTRNRP